MKMVYKLILLVFLSGCFLRPPSLTVTDKFLEVKNPGQSWAFVELNNIVLDSLFGYPKSGDFVQSFVVVDRKTEKPIRGRAVVKMFFFNRSKRYKWKNYRDINLQESRFLDSVHLKPDTWYKLSSFNGSYQLYIFRDKLLDSFIVKERPKTASW